MIMKGKLYLIPNHLGDNPENDYFSINTNIFDSISTIIVENGKEARKFMKSLSLNKALNEFEYLELNKHTTAEEYSTFLDPILKGENMGLISDAGCPGVADPGAEIVALAHKEQIQVVPLTGPSSILLALMASGMNGQKFAFHGYLPRDQKERSKAIKELEQRSAKEKETEIFIETPYRNEQMLKDLLSTCNPSTQICVACNLTQKDEMVFTTSVSNWKKRTYDLHKKPSIFLLLSGGIF